MVQLDRDELRVVLGLVVLGGIAGMVVGARYMRDMKNLANDAARVAKAARPAKKVAAAYVPPTSSSSSSSAIKFDSESKPSHASHQQHAAVEGHQTLQKVDEPTKEPKPSDQKEMR
jgi:hypothetical protein